MSTLEDRNYWNDSRVIASMCRAAYKVLRTNSTETVVELSDACLESLIEDEILPEGHDGKLKGGTKFEVCGCCRGSGSVVNPSIDCCGLTQSDFDDDPDFYDDYMGGAFDVTCPECKGNRVVPHIVFADPKIAKAIAEWIEEDAAFAREIAHERSMGY